VIILDEAYGVADSHQISKANDNLAEVIHQSRKKKVEVFFSTQLEGDLYKRVRTSAHRKVLCENIKNDKEPILRYTIMNQNDEVLRRIVLSTDLVRRSYPLFNTDEIIMPMHLNPETNRKEILDIYNTSSDKNTFYIQMRQINPFFIRDDCNAGYNLIKAGYEDRAMKIFKVK
jgi:DNA helicase HerA-like ATPase